MAFTMVSCIRCAPTGSSNGKARLPEWQWDAFSESVQLENAGKGNAQLRLIVIDVLIGQIKCVDFGDELKTIAPK